MTVTKKNTKDEILEEYNKAIKELKNLKEGKTVTAEIVKERENKKTVETANKIIEMNILNDTIVNDYKELTKAKQILTEEIEELHGIKREANSLEALFNAHKDSIVLLKAEYEAEKAKLITEKETAKDLVIATKNAEIEKLEAAIVKLKEEEKETKTSIAKERAREEEEYKYDFQRKKQKEEDTWNDEKAKREKELADKEVILVEREETMDDLLSTIDNLNKTIEALDEQHKLDIEKAYAEGKAKSDKQNAIAKSYIEKEAKWTKEKLSDKITSLEEDLSKERAAHDSTKAKLDESYSKIQEIATTTVQANGTIKIVENSKN